MTDKIPNERSNNKNTYLVKSDFYSDEFIDEYFDKRGNWQKVSTGDLDKPVDFVYLDGMNFINPKYYNIKCKLKNAVDDSKRMISLKHNLMDNLAKIPAAKKFIMPQITLDLNDPLPKISQRINNFYQPGRIYIFKPIMGMSGSGISMVENKQSLFKTISQIQQKYKPFWNRNKQNPLKNKDNPDSYLKDKNRIYVLQEYITNPYLVELPKKQRAGKFKFHIRHYFLYQPRPRPSFYKKVGEVAVALKPYKHGDWTNKEIHDTHFRDNFFVDQDELVFTPNESKAIEKQISELYQILYQLIHAQCYQESKQCFEIFGLDIMICDDLTIRLIEVNSSPGLDKKDVMFRNKKELFEGIMNIVVDSHFPPSIPQSYKISDYFEKIKPARITHGNKLTVKSKNYHKKTKKAF